MKRVEKLISHLSKNMEEEEEPINLTLQIEETSSSSNNNNNNNSNKNPKVRIGDVSFDIFKPQNAELVPFDVAKIETGLNKRAVAEDYLVHLRWMIQKVKLSQDIFLIGAPTPIRRWLSFLFCEITQQECEYVALSRDTTEADLKQRREIVNKGIVWKDQAPVRAAIFGRILIIDGIEKCERNVLPVLNNLLENREMSLEDGRFLMSHTRYDSLLEKKTHSKEELDQMKFVRVHPNFFVICLGLPVPFFQGNRLDPPIRSRFQARVILPLKTDLQLRWFLQFQNAEKAKDKDFLEKMTKIAAFVETIQKLEFEGTNKKLD